MRNAMKESSIATIADVFFTYSIDTSAYDRAPYSCPSCLNQL
jgi:hypothetical protein